MKKKYTRRQFVKMTSVTALGSAALMSPLGSLAQDEPKKFKKRSTVASDHFYTLNPKEESGECSIFIYTDNKFTDIEFELAKAFTEYKQNFVIGIYKRIDSKGRRNDLPTRLNSFTSFLDQQVQFTRSIFWFYSFDSQISFAKSALIQIDPANNKVDFFRRTEFGKEGKAGFISVEALNVNAIASFDQNNNAIVIASTLDSENDFAFNAHHSKGKFKEIEIPVSNKTSFGNQQTLVSQNLGSIRFRTERFIDYAIKPFSPYIVDGEATNTRKLIKIDYFDNKTYRDNIDLLVTFYPFGTEDFTNNTTTPTFFELKNKTGNVVLFNSVDKFGKRFFVQDFDGFMCRMVKVEFDSNPEYLFIPYNKLNIQNTDAQSQLLLGYSGTERTDITDHSQELIFVSSEHLYAKGDSLLKSLDLSGQQTDSLTSKIWIRQRDYYVDADKSPLFINIADQNDNNSKSTSYESILFGKVGDSAAISNATILSDAILKAYIGKEKNLETKLISTIPFFAFKNPDPDSTDPSIALEHLLKLEKVFTNYRKLGLVQAPVQKNKYVTPQGFLRENNEFNYIRRDDNKKPLADKKNFRFSLKEVDPDFDLSMTKEDVFFVTTPKLLAEAKTNIEFDIFFSIRGFDVNLILNSIRPGLKTDNNRIIIFKFSKHSVEELYSDVSKWSNWNRYIRKDTQGNNSFESLKKIITQKFSEFSTGYKKNSPSPTNDYYYIDQVVKVDKNWNGVIILDVPISLDDLPLVINGLTSSQDPSQHSNPTQTDGKPLQFTKSMKFEYVAFPVNKTRVVNKQIDISSTSFFGLINYDLLEAKDQDYTTVSHYFLDNINQSADYKFLLTKLLVRFENSEIRNFQSFAFIKIKQLFENKVIKEDNNIDIENQFQAKLNHNKANLAGSGDFIDNLIRLNGNYQKNSAGVDVFTFNVNSFIRIALDNNKILHSLDITSISFSWVINKVYRFDFNANANFTKDDLIGEAGQLFKNLISFESIEFGNIGLQFDLGKITFPSLDFDLSKLFVLPKISFNCNGFLSSFPIKFNRFQIFNVLPDLSIPDFGFFDLPAFKLPVGKCSLWSFVFDFDFGTLGDLSFLKLLKGELLLGWTKLGGFKLGFKINGSYDGAFHINLFGALKFDINQVELCFFDRVIDGKNRKQYLLKLVDARLTILNLELPGKNNQFSALIFANPGNKIAWLISYTQGNDPDIFRNKLTLGIGQRVGIVGLENITTVDDAIHKVKKVFDPSVKICETKNFPIQYQPQNNWLVASENIIPDSLSNVVDVKFIFNDPVLYGIFLKLVGLFSIDVLYKKLSDDLGVWSLEFAIDPKYRTIDAGELVITLPNLGIDISTNGDWKLDVGFPKGNEWTRSCLVQLRPFVGWCGIYIARLKTASLSLFAPYDRLLPQTNGKLDCTIFQAGFAIRIGIGAYIDKGIFYVGASISVYGILEGAFAFNTTNGGNALSQLLPDHFVLAGRIGAIAELVGYVDFKIVKASIHIILRVEVGFTLAYISYSGFGSKDDYGLQPVPLYIEGEVTVEIDFTICCFSVFGHHICITIHLSFHAYVRFAYTIGGSGSNNFIEFETPDEIIVDNDGKDQIIPVILIPAFTKGTSGTENHFIANFAIPFFGFEYKFRKDDDKHLNGELSIGTKNIIKDNILRPLFHAIFKAVAGENGEISYQNLKTILKGQIDTDGDEKKKTEIKFSFPRFKPVLLKGFDRSSMIDEDFLTFLHDYFFIGGDEADKYLKNSASDICSTDPPNCLYKPVPIPIPANRLSIIEKDHTSLSFPDGFIVEVKNISDNDIPQVEFLPHLNYSGDQLSKLSKDVKSYKTQNDGLEPKEANVNDLREDVIIPEYFKLLGLLTLEAYYNFANQQSNEQRGQLPDDQTNASKSTSINPLIKLSDLINDRSSDPDDSQWNLNNAIPGIIGQLNYIYNNGQRIVDAKNSYSPYYEVLRQTSKFNGALTDTKFADASISIFDKTPGGQIGQSVELKNELFKTSSLTTAELNFKEFINRGNNILNIAYTDLRNQFSSLEFKTPYQLIPVKIQVQNSRMTSDDNDDSDNKIGFFEISQKVRTHFKPSEKYSMNLFLAEASTADNGFYREPNKTDISLNTYASACINISLNVKLHSNSRNEIVAMELADVFADDLILLTAIKQYFTEADYNSSSINLYVKNEGDNKIVVSLFETNDITIIKTNLSPKSSPPVILLPQNHFQDNPENTAGTFYANLSEDKINFIRILWEGMTTNNGGFFFVRKDKQKFGSLKGETTKLILSVEAGIEQPIFSFANFLKLRNGDIAVDTNQKKLYDQLSGNKQYLYLAMLKSSRNAPVLEYYARIPAHCMSFEVRRNLPALKPGSNLDPAQFYHYIPIDFSVKKEDGTLLINSDEIIPVMPETRKDDGKFAFYNHITPLVTYEDNNVLNRYAAINKQFRLSFSLRDIYGFRTTDILTETNYTHRYFDKLIPVSSFPLVKFSYWYDEQNKINAGVSNWKLKFETNTDKNTVDNLLKDPEAKRSTLEKLYSVKAQLTDKNLELYILNGNPDVSKTEHYDIALDEPKRELEKIIDAAIAIANGGSRNPVSITLNFRVPLTGFKTMLNPYFIQKRNVPDDLFTDKNKMDAVWDYDQVMYTKEKIVLVNSDIIIDPNDENRKLENSLYRLNGLIDSSVASDYTLGVGVINESLERSVFLIKKTNIRTIKPKEALTADKNFFGIKPYSTSLWSGSYNNRNFSEAKQDYNFSDLDLDHSLKIVLAKIDEFLNPLNIANLNQEDLNTLIECKQKLVKGTSQIAEVANNYSELASKLENINHAGSHQLIEFENLLLDHLINFYNYDGIINCNVISDHELIGHRLKVDVNVFDNTGYSQYQIQSSRLFFKTTDDVEWTLLFDYLPDNSGKDYVPSYTFKADAVVTHIEFDVTPVDNGVERSQWIQLLNPVKLTDRLSIDDFPSIIREYPPKPSILLNDARQCKNEEDPLSWNYDLGNWQYLLGMSDSNSLAVNDKINIKLNLFSPTEVQKFAPDDFRNFEGLISYWTQVGAGNKYFIEISKSEFITDLAAELKKAANRSPAATPGQEIPNFIFKKTGISQWQLVSANSNPDIYLIDEQTNDLNAPPRFPQGGTIKEIRKLFFHGPNVLSGKNKKPIVSIKPDVWITRNDSEKIRNPNFKYRTATVSPSTWTTIHLRYNNAIFIESDKLQDVLDSVADKNKKAYLPTKSSIKHELNADSLESKRDLALPTIPVKQVELNVSANVPADIDDLFKGYQNGYPTISLTISNLESVDDNNLPVFFCNTVFKKLK